LSQDEKCLFSGYECLLHVTIFTYWSRSLC